MEKAPKIDVAIASLLAFFPFSIFIGYAVNTAALVVLGTLLLFKFSGKVLVNNLLKINPFSLSMGYFLWMFLSGIWSENTGEFWDEINSKLVFLIAPIVFLGAPKALRFQVKWAKIALAIAPIVMGLVCVAFAISEIPKATNVYELFVYETFARPARMQPIYFAMFCVMGLFSAYTLWVKNLKAKPFAWTVIAANALLVIMLSSRMEIMVLVILLSLLLIYEGYQRKILFKIFGILTLGIALIAGIILANPTNRLRFAEMLDFSNQAGETKYGGRSLRIQKWQNAVEAISDKPFFGTGAGDLMDELLVIYRNNDFEVGITNYYNPHNQFLQTAVTYGFVGFAIWMLMYLSILKSAFQEKNQFLILLVATVLLSMISESILERQTGAMLAGFYPLLFYLFKDEKSLNKV